MRTAAALALLALALGGPVAAANSPVIPAKAGTQTLRGEPLGSRMRGNDGVGKTAAKHDWLSVVAATPEGGFRMGNPAAPVKLVEYGSLTCSHCKAFEDDGGAQLRAEYIAKGSVSYEYRSYVLNSADYAAAVLARCDGPAAFFTHARRFYATQPEWTKPYYDLGQDRILELATLPPPRAIAETVRAIGLDKRLRAEGWDQPHIDRCLSDRAAIDRLAVIRAAAQDQNIEGTPAFLINGKPQTADFMGQQRQIILWSDVEPRLAQALRGSGARGKVGR